MGDQYQPIPPEEIRDAARHAPDRAVLMMFGNAVLADARRRASGAQPYVPEYREQYSMAIETSNGIVGLHCGGSTCADTTFHIGYPKRTSYLINLIPDNTVIAVATSHYNNNRDKFVVLVEMPFNAAQARRFLTLLEEAALMELLQRHGVEVPAYEDGAPITDELIMEMLDVQLAQPVRSDRGGRRLWGKFYGPRLDNDAGRVWIDHSEWTGNEFRYSIPTSDSPEALLRHFHTSSYARNIVTHPYSHYNELAPEAPNATHRVVLPYRDKFLALTCEIVRQMGGATGVSIEYGYVLLPEQLPEIGFTDIEWLKGQPGNWQGYRADLVRASRRTDAGTELLVLESANELVPWVATRRIPHAGVLTPEMMLELLVF